MAGNKKIYFYIASNLALLIPVPGRFAYALVLLVLFNVQMISVTLLFHAIHRLRIGNLQNSILALTIIALGIFYKQILTIFCPIIAFTLGFCIFLPTLASVIIEFFFLSYEHGLKSHLINNMKTALFMTIFALFFFLIRDIFGYGTFTLPAWKKLLVFHLPYNPNATGASVFLATVPGGLCLVSILLMAYIFIMNKLRIFSHAPSAGEEENT